MAKARFIFSLGTFLLFTPALKAHDTPERVTGNINLVLGNKSLHSADWSPVEEQAEVGFESDFGKPSWPLHYAFDYLQTSSVEKTIPVSNSHSALSIKGKTEEIHLGFRGLIDTASPVHLSVSGGLAFIEAEFRARANGLGELSDTDRGVGYFAGAGAYFTLAQAFNIGLNARLSVARVKLFGTGGEAGGRSLGVTAGYPF